MCATCTTASQHFAAGTVAPERQLETSVDQGTSPDWSSAGNDGDHDYR